MRLQLESAISHSGDTAQVAAQGSRASGGAGQTRNGPADSIGISGPSAALSQFAADRAGRVQQLTQAVRSGSYQVPSTAISASIVDQSLA